MAARAELKAKLGLDKSAFSKGLKAAYGEAKAFGAATSRAVSGAAKAGLVALAVGAVAAGAALAAGVKHAYDLGGELSDMSAKTGIAADQIMILQQAAKDSGIEDITGAIAKMQKNLVEAATKGGDAAKALGFLGLNAEDLLKKLPVDQLKIIGEQIAKIQNPAIKTAMAMEIFGKSGAELLPLLNDLGSLDTAANSIGKQAKILKENAAAFDNISDRLGRAGLKLQGFFVGVASTILPYMDAVTKRFDDLDLAEQGEKFGAGLNKALEFIAGASTDIKGLADFAEASFDYAFKSAGNVLIAAMKSGVDFFTMSFTTGMKGIGEIIISTMIEAFSKPIAYLQAQVERVLENMPGGKGAEKAKAAEQFRAQESEYFKRASQEADPVKERRFLELAARAKKLREEAESGPTPEERQKRILAEGVKFGLTEGGQNAAQWREQGKKDADAFFQGFMQTAKEFKIQDVLGAGASKPAFTAAARKLATEGKTALATAAAPNAKPVTPKTSSDWMKNLKGTMLGGNSTSSSLTSGSNAIGQSGFDSLFFKGIPYAGVKGMFGSSLDRKPFGQTPILSHREKMQYENAAVASGAMNRDARGSAPGAKDVIRRGDAKRAKAIEKEEAKKKMTLEGTNERLDKVIGLLGDNAGPVKAN